MVAVFVVLNPVAGNSRVDEIRALLRYHFARHSLSYEIYETTGEEDLVAIVDKAISQGCKLVVAVGGDGTVSAVADALFETGIPLGIIPTGTGNLLARDLAIPLEAEQACRLLHPQAPTLKIDGMCVGQHLFISHVSMGVYSHIIKHTTPEEKQRLGRVAYLWATLREVVGYPTWRFDVAVDGRPRRVRASLVMAANVAAVGVPPLRWGDDIYPDDGEIALCVVRARTAADYFRLIWNAFQQRHHASEQIYYLHARETITLRTKHPVPVRADGEIIGDSAVQIQIIPHAIPVIVPDHSEQLPTRE